jgi:hypothetical protein
MLTINIILKEIKDVPVSRLEELYQFVHSLKPAAKKTNTIKKKILSFSGILGDMSCKDYSDFTSQTIRTRKELFDRKFEI